MNFKKKLGDTAGKITELTGTGTEEVYDEDEMRNKLQKALENDDKTKDLPEVDKQLTLDHVMKEIEAIQSQAKELGRQEERMKGQDSDDLYNMVVLNLMMTGVLLLMYVWQNFF